jgi:hypothetical protein
MCAPPDDAWDELQDQMPVVILADDAVNALIDNTALSARREEYDIFTSVRRT